MSSTSPNLPMGTLLSIASPFIAPSDILPLSMSVRMNPGAIAFTMMLCFAHSVASSRVSIMTPALLVA